MASCGVGRIVGSLISGCCFLFSVGGEFAVVTFGTSMLL